MVASRQVEIPFHRSIGRQKRRGFGALAQVKGRTENPLLHKSIVPAAKRVDADLLEFAVPKIAVVVSGRKNCRTSAQSVGRQTPRKWLGSGSRKKSASSVVQTKSANQTRRSPRDIYTNIFPFFFNKHVA